MGVHKSLARLVAADGAVIGAGRAYVHLRLPPDQAQQVSGTLSLDWWSEVAAPAGAQLELEGGPTLALRLESDRLSECVRGRILRYAADWPGAPPP